MIEVVAAGILLAPAVLVIVGIMPVIALLSIPGLAILLYSKKSAKLASSSQGTTKERRRAIITGGSSGIGLCVAKECVELGFNEVIIMARNADKLEKAKSSLLTGKGTKVEAASVDVSSPEALAKAANTIFSKKDEEEPTSTYLFCCAGVAYPMYFQDLKTSHITTMIQTNQLGAIHTVQAILPHMTSGSILLCSSAAGLVGVFGYTAYSSTKFGLRGFAEALHMELCARPINVCVAYPPDTDTPGFEQENLTKPEETRLVSEGGGLATAVHVARTMVTEVLKPNPKFAISFDFDGWMLTCLTAGFSPVTTLVEAVAQVAGCGLFRIISLFYLKEWWRMIRNYQLQKSSSGTDKILASDEQKKSK